MSTISLRLPDSLHAQARALAKADHVSINQLVTTALAEKIAALLTVEYLEARAARGSRAAFDAVLAEVRARGAPPVPGDEIGDERDAPAPVAGGDVPEGDAG
ncbi:hypothetical protein tb265_42580 [Gemmatimonadetes bacterium T265]|nr:hypothetical protein tb265_42580 [Gemmatimonadetes bacterium T265]